jgi:hypothetical protein
VLLLLPLLLLVVAILLHPLLQVVGDKLQQQ